MSKINKLSTLFTLNNKNNDNDNYNSTTKIKSFIFNSENNNSRFECLSMEKKNITVIEKPLNLINDEKEQSNKKENNSSEDENDNSIKSKNNSLEVKSNIIKNNVINSTTNKFFSNKIKFIENKRNNENIPKKIYKCCHKRFFVSYCTSNSENDGGLICYECLYKYHGDHISKCLPIKKNAFNFYKNHYKRCINKYRNNLKNLFDRMQYILDYFENETIDEISTFFEKKLNLNFDLPIEIPFKDRFEMAVNRKLTSLFNKQINIYNNNCLNLFQGEFETLYYKGGNPNKLENIILKSSYNFDLLGIGIPILNNQNEKSIKIKVYKEDYLLESEIRFSTDSQKRLSKLIFNTKPINIESEVEYRIEINGIYGLPFISNFELYNKNSKIKINSSNSETMLACLIIK